MSRAKFAETQDDGLKDLFGGSLVATAGKAARAEWLKSAFGGRSG